MAPLFLRSSKRHSQAEIDDAVLTLSEKTSGAIEWPLSRQPSRWFFALAFLGMAFLAGRLMYLNLVRGEQYADLAARNSSRALVLPAPRGIFYDRYGKALVKNVPSVDAFIVPQDLPQAERERQLVLKRLQETLSLTETERQELGEAMLAEKPFLLKHNLSQNEMIVLVNRAKELPGLHLLKTARREYFDGSIFSHVLGYEGNLRKEELVEFPDYALTDSVGKQGLEKSYERELRGTSGAERVEVDALGRIQRRLGVVSPSPGRDLLLSLDAELQRTIHDALGTWLEKRGLRQAAAIALDPRDGSVLALVSFPTYDNNLFARGLSTEAYARLAEDEAKPLFNRAVAGVYPPGSTIKPLYAAAALAENLIRPETTIESRGGITVGQSFFGDWRAHGFTDLRRAIAVSSDVYFYSIGGGYGNIPGLGIERMRSYAMRFGFAERSDIDLPGEATGLFPSPEWKRERLGERWYVGDDYNTSIGQGFVTATPLQIVNAIAAIANGGTLYEPRLVSGMRSSDGETRLNPPMVKRELDIPASILQVVREGMRETITEGTARSLQDLPVAVAGKTGTAQFGNEEKTHGWFVSFAPYEAPRIALIVLVEGQGEEGYNAVPITKDILANYFSRPE